MDKTDTERKMKEMKPQSHEKVPWGTRDTDLKDAKTNKQPPKKGGK